MDNVALLAEGVDRNTVRKVTGGCVGRSPSLRRAWIEIILVSKQINMLSVALLAEGVDRNMELLDKPAGQICRPPCGGRG